MATLLDNIRKMITGEAPQAPVARHVGFTLLSVDPGRATFTLDVDMKIHSNPMGTLHGGILCDVADAAMGVAYASELTEGESFTTLELKTNFFKPVWKGKLRAEGRVVRRGKTVGMVECDVFDEGGSLVAKASSTCMTLRGAQATGR
ncbi:MAG: PaaI family thioesterase [Myxococcaceae bacterium]